MAAAIVRVVEFAPRVPCGRPAFRGIMQCGGRIVPPIANVGMARKKVWPRTRMSSAPDAIDTAVIEAFSKIPTWLERSEALVTRGRFLDCDCLLGPVEQPFHVAIRAGRIVDLAPAPVLMRSWRFSYRATARALAQHWQPMPRPGWHDLLALT